MQLADEAADEEKEEGDSTDDLALASNRNHPSSKQQQHDEPAVIESAKGTRARMKGDDLTTAADDQSDTATISPSAPPAAAHIHPSMTSSDNKSSIPQHTVAIAEESKQNEESKSFFQKNNVPFRARAVGFFMFLILLMLVLIAIYGIKAKTAFNLGYFSLGREGTNLADVLEVFHHHKGSLLLDVTTSNTDNVYQSKSSSSYRRLVSASVRKYLSSDAVDYTTDDVSLTSFSSSSSSLLTSPVQSIDQMVDRQSLGYNHYVPFDHGTAVDDISVASDTAVSASIQQFSSTSRATNNHHVDYKVTGCWGISLEQSKYIDEFETPSFHLRNFQKYLTDTTVRPNKLGIVEDFKAFCEYIIKNRDYLDIHPQWQESECIYNSFINTYSKSKISVNNAFIAMAQNYAPFGAFIGVRVNSTTVSTIVEWVCTNVSLRTSDTMSLYDDVSFGLKLQERWDDAFQTYGGTYANKNNVPIIVSSSEFTYPLLGRHIRNNLWVSAVVITIGTFLAMLCLFSFEFVLTLLTGLSMITIFIFTVYMGLMVISWRIDLGTLIALNIMVPLSIVFPLYMSYQILTCDDLHEEKIGLHKPSSSYENYDLFYYRYLLEDVIQMPPHAVRAVLASNLSLLQPLFLSIIAGVSFIGSDFKALQKIGYWFILCALTSYVYTALVLPLLLMLPSKTNCCGGDRWWCCWKKKKSDKVPVRRRTSGGFIGGSTDHDEYYEPYYQTFQVVKDPESIPVEDEYANLEPDGRNIYRQLADRREIIGRYYGSSMVAGPEQSVMYMDRDMGMDRSGFDDLGEGYDQPDSYHYDYLSYNRRPPYHGGYHNSSSGGMHHPHHPYHHPPYPMDLPVDDIINGHISLRYRDDPLLGVGPPSPSSSSPYLLSDDQYAYDHPSYGNGSNSLTYEQSMMLQQYPFAAGNILGSQSLQGGRNYYLPRDPSPLPLDYSLINRSSRYPANTTNASSSSSTITTAAADYSSRYYEPAASNYSSSYEPSGIASRPHVSYRPHIGHRPPATVRTTVQYPSTIPMPMHSSIYSSSQYSASAAGGIHSSLQQQQSNYMSSYHPSETTLHAEYQSSQTNSEYPLTVGSTYYDRQSTIDESIIVPSSYVSSTQRSRQLGTNTDDDDDDDDDDMEDLNSIPQSLLRDRGALPRPVSIQRDVTGASMFTRSSDGGFI